jgi:hypothetical protein
MQVYFREVQTIVNEDAFYLPMGHEWLAPVDVADIAKVARPLVREGGHDDQSYDMTGPEALTMAEIAQRISYAVGRSIRYVDIDADKKHRMLVDAGMERYFADALDELFSERRERSRIDCAPARTNGSASGPPRSPSSPPAMRPCSGASPAHDHTRRGLPLANRTTGHSPASTPARCRHRHRIRRLRHHVPARRRVRRRGPRRRVRRHRQPRHPTAFTNRFVTAFGLAAAIDPWRIGKIVAAALVILHFDHARTT